MSTAPSEEKTNPSDRHVVAIARVFRRYGYEAASLSLLSRETGLGRSSLYHFFPGGKEDMARAVLDLAERFVRDDLMARLLAPGPREARVEAYIAKLRDYYEGGAVGCLYGALSLHDCPPAIAARVGSLTAAWIGAIAVYLRERGDGQPQAQAEKVVRLIQGGLVVALATRNPGPFEASLDDVRPILRGQNG